MHKLDQDYGRQAFGPTFFALAGFVNEATLSAQPTPAGPTPSIRKPFFLSSFFGRKQRHDGAPARPENADRGLSPTLGAIAGFVTTATGGLASD